MYRIDTESDTRNKSVDSFERRCHLDIWQGATDSISTLNIEKRQRPRIAGWDFQIHNYNLNTSKMNIKEASERGSPCLQGHSSATHSLRATRCLANKYLFDNIDSLSGSNVERRFNCRRIDDTSSFESDS